MSHTTRKYPANPSVSIISNSWSITRHARARSDKSSLESCGRIPYLRVAPASASLRRYEISFNPSGHGNGGSCGATNRKSNAALAPSSAACCTTPGYRAKRRSCSAPLRKYAVAAGGKRGSMSSKLERSRTAATAVASLC